jgi:pimeloyl-ACP methyl ester carboxylesterase
MSKLHIIYIPGIGDSNIGQRLAVASWRLYGVRSEVTEMGWGDSEAWEKKFTRLLSRIDAAREEGYEVALAGASAGATAALNAYAARPQVVRGVVTIAGKINHPESIGKRYRKRNPAFIVSANDVPASVASLGKTHRNRILCLYALYDGIIPKQDSQLPDAHNLPSPSIGHALTIGLQITLGAGYFIHFLKKTAKQH